MSNLPISDPDNYATCPYDPTHRILWKRVPLHLVKCRKQHLLTPLQSCPFDTKHLVPQQELHVHMLHCEAKAILWSDIASNATKQERLLDEPEGSNQDPEEVLFGCAPTSASACQRNKKLPCQLKMVKTLTNLDTLSQNEKDELWDEHMNKNGIIAEPFRFGERSLNPDSANCPSYSLGGNVIPLRQPLDVVQISESRQARRPTVYSYAMNSMGIGRGRGAGRGRSMQMSESCSGSDLMVSQIGSLGVGRARNRLLH